ncbi:serine/threonine protein kinase [Paracoccidioides brasiliensis Pb03]|nr:serine/threonine protein kinase [Paracoccidioides brasiliensis Pb03]
MSTALADSGEYIGQSGHSYRIERVLQEEKFHPRRVCLATVMYSRLPQCWRPKVHIEVYIHTVNYEDLQEIYNRLRGDANHVRLVQDTIPEKSMFVFEYYTDHLLNLAQKDLPLKVKKKILKHALCGIVELHDQDIVHTDIKPVNVFIDWKGDRDGIVIDRVQLGDLEDAAHIPPGSHMIGKQVGNRMWRSPEAHAEGPVNKPSDIFSFALVELDEGVNPLAIVIEHQISYFADEDALNGFLKYLGGNPWVRVFEVIRDDSRLAYIHLNGNSQSSSEYDFNPPLWFTLITIQSRSNGINLDLFPCLAALSVRTFAFCIRAKPVKHKEKTSVIQGPPTESQHDVTTWNFDVWNAVLGLIDTVSRVTTPPRPISSIQQTPWLHNTSSFVNSTEYRKHVDFVLKEELGEIHVDIPSFFDAEGWRGWPELAAERDVLRWLTNIIAELVRSAEAQELSWKIGRRPLAQPSQPLQGSVAERKLDIGFVDDMTATEDSRCRWSQILVPGELKNGPKYDRKSGAWFDLGRYAREVLAAQDARHFVLSFTLCGPFLQLWNFDRLGGIASEEFNINQDGLQFVSVILGFLLMSRKQLGFDPTIIATGTKCYIEIEKNATTCWKAYCETDKSHTPLVVKDSWQYPERTEEGELLQEAMGLCIPISQDEKGGGFKATVQCSRSQRGQKSRSSTAGQKRSSDCVDTAFLPPPSKRTQSSSPSKSAGCSTPFNQVHRRIVIRDYGKPIYESSSKATLLTGLAGCIEGYISLHDEAGLIQCDISPRNLMANEDKDNP